ncbi:MAG TPA: cytochrome c oxidase subunit 3 family protein [Fibrobacteria bacterium]|jgi:cytochrome c oxidase subunit 3|nr:cytochrome c oxidase subunit 3 family protein [Fibrobacteria bacterium]
MSAQATAPKEHEVAHHFDDLEQEFESHRMGMWLFLASEIMMFGALLVGGFGLLYRFPGAFAEGRAHLDWRLGAINTFFLLTSGFTMALAALHGQRGDQAKVRRSLWLSLLFAAGFLVVKAYEYSTKFHHGTLPGKFWRAEGFTDPHAHVFFGYYFAATGLHVLHVLIGMGLMVWCLIVSRKVKFTRGYITPVELSGLYWALIDLVWFVLFPLLYLVG